ncbi:MAG: yhbF [Paenibacillus sp.]|jgi:cytoskeletal protein CcmA (bactofilin family)|nr:yhbF [Paenibacillus sp.]
MELYGAAYGDLIINGIGSASAGQYDRVDVQGVGTINGDIFSNSVKASGHLKARGSIATHRLECDGTLRIDGNLQADEATINGTVKVGGSLSGDKLDMNGLIKIGDDCEMDFCAVKGGFTVGGLLNAGQLELDILTRCQAREIGGETIRVRKASSSKWSQLVNWLVPAYSTELHVNTVEGDYLDLEVTTAEVVRGNRIIIGKGCVIGRVEYSGELTVLPGAKVGEEINTNGNSSFA